MARDHARINLDIWNDPDFRDLPGPAQHLYLMLWTHPDLTYCGSLDWRPAKLSGLCAMWTKETVTEAAACLQARYFVVVDEDSEELLVRSWIRFDGLLKQPRMAISCITSYGAMGSQVLRQVVVHEMQKRQAASPEWACWSDERVLQILSHPAVSAKDLPTPADPFAASLDPVCPQLAPNPTSVSPLLYTPSTPTPATTPSYKEKSDASASPPSRGTRLDEGWEPTDEQRATLAAKRPDVDLDIELEKFVNYWTAKTGKDATKLNWPRTFTNWVLGARSSTRPTRPTGLAEDEGWS